MVDMVHDCQYLFMMKDIINNLVVFDGQRLYTKLVIYHMEGFINMDLPVNCCNRIQSSEVLHVLDSLKLLLAIGCFRPPIGLPNPLVKLTKKP